MKKHIWLLGVCLCLLLGTICLFAKVKKTMPYALKGKILTKLELRKVD